MIPVALDPRRSHVAVAGNGEFALRRLRGLRAAGAVEAVLYADAPSKALRDEAGAWLRPALPNATALAELHALWIADLNEAAAVELAAQARAQKVLVSVEDKPALCDFHSVAEVRRGDLLLTVSTNGAAPGLASTIRRNLERSFGPEWSARVDEVAGLRGAWRAEGVGMAEAARRIEALVAERCWLPAAAAN